MTNATKHTPTPYCVGKPADMGQPLFEISSDASTFWIVGVGAPDEVRQIAEANARFIVRACNAHDALVAALEAADALDMPYKEVREVLIRHGWDETCQPTKFVESLRRAALALGKEQPRTQEKRCGYLEERGALRTVSKRMFRSLAAFMDYAPVGLREQCYAPKESLELGRIALQDTALVCITCGELVPQGCCTCGPRQRLEGS